MNGEKNGNEDKAVNGEKYGNEDKAVNGEIYDKGYKSEIAGGHSKNAFFPLFMDLEGKKGLVIGGGKTALGKVRHLLDFGPDLTVIAPEFCPELIEAAATLSSADSSDSNPKDPQSGRLILEYREFCPEDIREDLTFVIAATDRGEVNRLAASICREKRIPVNVVDVPKECTFFFPSLVRQGRLCVGISTGGASPSAAIHMRRRIEEILPEGIGDILDYLAEKRSLIKESFVSEKERGEAYRQFFLQCLQQGRGLSEEEEKELLRQVRS